MDYHCNNIRWSCTCSLLCMKILNFEGPKIESEKLNQSTARVTFILSSTNPFYLDQSVISSFGEGYRQSVIMNP